MDENGLIEFMKQKKKPIATITSYVNRVKRFEKYLKDERENKSITELQAGDLADYVKWCTQLELNPYQELWGIREYYQFLGIDELHYACNDEMQMIQLTKFKLKDFLTANQEYAKKLTKVGIKTASQILMVGKTKEEREVLATQAEVPIEELTKFVKLANLARSPGQMKVRACLYYESGLDTFDKIAAYEPKEMILFLEEYIKKTGFKGSAPVLGDAQYSVENAKRIPRIIQW